MSAPQTGDRRARQWQSGEHRSRCECSRGVDALARPIERHLLRAKDFVDRHDAGSIDVDALAPAAGHSRAHFSPQFRRAFGQPPHVYVLKRRLVRAASLLRAGALLQNCYMVRAQRQPGERKYYAT